MAEHDLIKELRDAVERHDDWPTPQTLREVAALARRFIQVIDMRAAMIEDMRQHVTPMEQAIGELLGNRQEGLSSL